MITFYLSSNRIIGIIEKSLKIPAIMIINSVAIISERYVPNGTKMTVAKIAKEAIIW